MLGSTIDRNRRNITTQWPEAVGGRPRHHVSLDGLVADLRRTSMDPAATPSLRRTAVERLALLAGQQYDDGRPVVPVADPATWWSLAPICPTQPKGLNTTRLMPFNYRVSSLWGCESPTKTARARFVPSPRTKSLNRYGAFSGAKAAPQLCSARR